MQPSMLRQSRIVETHWPSSHLTGRDTGHMDSASVQGSGEQEASEQVKKPSGQNWIDGQ